MKKRIGIVIAGIIIVLVGRGFFYQSGFYHAPPTKMPSYEQIAVPEAPSTDFSDAYEKGEGTILIDLAHDNDFDIKELNVLILRLISRGLTIELFQLGDDLKEKLLGEEEEKVENLEEEPLVEEPLVEEYEEQKVEIPEEKPPEVNAFIVICPQSEFSSDEKDSMDEFVNNSGKLLLIADPTRHDEMNSLSFNFGLIFEPDYLYNMKENDTNFQNIFVTEFKESEITRNLDKIALYRAGSISSADGGIAFVDENTFSSLKETRKRLSPMALTNETRVLAIYDLTFMTEPYNGIFDNNQLISNVADWLASPAEEVEVEEEEKEDVEEGEKKETKTE